MAKIYHKIDTKMTFQPNLMLVLHLAILTFGSAKLECKHREELQMLSVLTQKEKSINPPGGVSGLLPCEH